ncbi:MULTISPECIES: MFS transporter [unclassified Duganella]|uniref:MFS transporter n=1 Tax=unclassified Duganella TaxID=2636909 RepID=UPI000E3464AD|nr:MULTISPECIES: MFS transporter [unclassified Duganella]RFP16225.1 MFS transporter [Duganella sp. BJB475]RFP32613.1 MFS transporter [Duganella sp. BJB476]
MAPQSPQHIAGNGPLIWLALGTFAVGTESFMIAGLLPGMAADLAVSVATAGQLVTVFALAYALSSPILTALTSYVSRRTLLIVAMGAFALANVAAWSAQDYWQLMTARVLLAFAAGLYVPGANALASAVVAPERRGTAIAIVNGGLSLAIAFGVPLGAMIGDGMGWRITFGAVAALSALATAGLAFGLPRGIGAGLATATLKERVQTAAQPAILLTLMATTLWAMASYTTYTYLALFVASATTLHGAQIGYILFAWGVSAALGLAISGKAIDRHGPRAVILPALTAAAISFALLSASAHLLPRSWEIVPVVVAVIAWGIAHWAYYPAQQTTLVGLAGVKSAPVVLSLNASFMYLGFSLGAGLGSLTITCSGVADLGYVSALSMLAALALTMANGRRALNSKLNPA